MNESELSLWIRDLLCGWRPTNSTGGGQINSQPRGPVCSHKRIKYQSKLSFNRLSRLMKRFLAG